MSAHPLTPPPDFDFEALLGVYPARRRATRLGAVGYREAGFSQHQALPVVLLHGIGSGAASWVQQFVALAPSRRVLAWDAPGYGESTPLEPASPEAADYARSLEAWLDVMGVQRCVLVGHSLGAIIAGAFAAMRPERIAGLLLISPASGYGAADSEVRASKRDARLAMLDELGPQGLAEKRSSNMLSTEAGSAARAWVRWNMSRIVPHGYRQATHLLANADLAGDLVRYTGHIEVAVGSADIITPPSGCEAMARAARTTLQCIPGAGHAGYIERPDAYTSVIERCCLACEEQRSE